jgi:transcriptional regulator with XRE-family HTH domain
MASHSDPQKIGQTVGARLRAARLARKLTQNQLAQPDFSVSYISAIERGQIQPSLRALEIFAQRLSISSTDLLSKQTGQSLQVFSEKDSKNEIEQDTELQLLEGQLFLLQGNYRQAVTVLRTLSSDTLKSQQEIRQCYLLGIALYHLDLLQGSESVLTEGLNKATQHNDFFVKYIRNALGLVYVSMHNHAQAMEYQLRNLDQLENEQHPHDAFFDAQVYTNIGLLDRDLNKIDDAIEMFQHALAQTKEFLSPEQLPMMYWNLSRYLAETQQYFLATLNGYKTLQLLIQENLNSLRSEMYHYLGQALLHQDQQKALMYLEELLQDASLEKDTLTFASITATTAELLYRQGNLKKAYEYAQKACKLASAYEDRIVTASIILTCASIAYAQKDYQVGDTQFMAGLNMLKRLNNRQELADQSARYAQLLAERGLSNEALKYYKQAYESSLDHE